MMMTCFANIKCRMRKYRRALLAFVYMGLLIVNNFSDVFVTFVHSSIQNTAFFRTSRIDMNISRYADVMDICFKEVRINKRA